MIVNWLHLADESGKSGDAGDVLFVVMVIVGVSLVALVLTRRRLTRRSGGGGAAAARAARSGQATAGAPATGQRGLHRSMQELLVELEEMSREINSQVDTRLRALNILVQEADEKIKELRRLQGLAPDEGPPVRHLPPPKAEPHPEETSERYARVYALAEKGHTVVEIAGEMGLMTGEVELILALRRTAAGRAEDAS